MRRITTLATAACLLAIPAMAQPAGNDRLATAAQLQAAMARSQPTVSRLLAALGRDVLVLGQGRSTRYALAEPFAGMPARLPLHWVHHDGRIEER